MTQSIQKTFLSLFMGAIMIVAFTTTTQAQEELRTLWDRTTDDAPDWFVSGTVRGMAYNNGYLYAADRTNTAIQVIDPETGADVTLDSSFDLTGVSGGTYVVNDIEISEDGKIFLGNMSTDASADPFKFYIFDAEGGAFENSFSFTASSAQRIGDRFTVVGSLEDNTVEVWFSDAGATANTIYVATTEDQGENWNIETITLTDGVTGTGSTVEPLAAGRDSDFYVGGNSAAPARYNSAGELIAGTALSSSSKSGITAFSANGIDYLAVYAYRNDGENVGDRIGRVYVYDISDETSPTLIAESSLMGDTDGGWLATAGEVNVVVNDDGTYTLYAVDGVNGIAAFTNAAAPLPEGVANLFFSEYIEGSGNNKAFEIYNPSDSEVSLADYQIAQASNGNGWQYYNGFAEGATIAAGGVYVIVPDDLDPNLFAHENADEVLSWPHPIGVNGNDARALIHIDPATEDTTWLDVFGDPDSDEYWDVAGVSEGAHEYTLLRKASVTRGNPNIMESFGTNADDSEWIVLNQNNFHNLGSPTKNLSGDYYIPRGTNDQGFYSMASAVNTINVLGLEGATTLYIADDLEETEAFMLDRDDLTEANSLTVKPAPGTTPTLSLVGGSGGDGFWIAGTDWVTVDGSNTEGGTTQDLTITSADTSFSAIFYVTGSNNVTIKNTEITYTGGDVGVYAIAALGSPGSKDFVVQNNLIGTSAGEFSDVVALRGGSGQEIEASIIDNVIYANYRAIATFNNRNNVFSGNTIQIANPREDRIYYAGIYLANNFGNTVVSGNEISGLSVNRTASATFAAGILLNGNGDTVNVVNNMVSAPEFQNLGAATENSVYGIMLNYAGDNAHYNVYHNTVHIGSSDETGIHAGFGSDKSATTQTWDFQNNIFSVAQDAENAYAFHWPMDTTNLSSNYNNFSVLGESASIAYADSAAAATLDDWFAATGQDENSTDVSVEFASDTDLRLAGESIGDHALAGTPLASVTTDIDGTARSETHPYKGAFEGDTPVPNETEIALPNKFSLSQNYPNPFNPTSNIKFNLPQSSDVKLQVYNMAGQLVSTLVDERMNAGEHTVQFNASHLASGVYIYRIHAGSFVQSKKMTLIK